MGKMRDKIKRMKVGLKNPYKVYFYLWLKHKCGIKEGEILPKWFRFIRFFFFPFDMIGIWIYHNKTVYYDKSYGYHSDRWDAIHAGILRIFATDQKQKQNIPIK